MNTQTLMCFNKVLLDTTPAEPMLSAGRLLYVTANLKNGRFEEGHYIFFLK